MTRTLHMCSFSLRTKLKAVHVTCIWRSWTVSASCVSRSMNRVGEAGRHCGVRDKRFAYLGVPSAWRHRSLRCYQWQKGLITSEGLFLLSQCVNKRYCFVRAVRPDVLSGARSLGAARRRSCGSWASSSVPPWESAWSPVSRSRPSLWACPCGWPGKYVRVPLASSTNANSMWWWCRYNLCCVEYCESQMRNF